MLGHESLMRLQGDLQTTFEVLDEMGVISSIVEKDWARALEEGRHYHESLTRLTHSLGLAGSNRAQLREALDGCSVDLLELIAIEVGRELADFHSRQVLH